MNGENKMKKNTQFFKKAVASMIFSVGILTFPFFASAVSWGVSVDTSGNLSASVGSNGYASGGWALSNPYNLPSGSLLGIASNLLFWLLSIFAVAGIIGFIISGIFYLIAAGDDGMMEKGKEGMKWSIIGIIVGLSGYVIMQAVASLLGGGSKSF